MQAKVTLIQTSQNQRKNHGIARNQMVTGISESYKC